MTGLGSGVLRDLLAPEVPFLVRPDREPWAVPALAGAVVVGIASTFDVDHPALGIGCAIAICAVRMLAPQPTGAGRRRVAPLHGNDE